MDIIIIQINMGSVGSGTNFTGSTFTGPAVPPATSPA